MIERAHHWDLAHDNLRALPSAWQAAAAAAHSLACPEKLVMLARVLELWDTQPDAPARIGGTRPDVREPEHRRGRAGWRGWEGR